MIGSWIILAPFENEVIVWNFSCALSRYVSPKEIGSEIFTDMLCVIFVFY